MTAIPWCCPLCAVAVKVCGPSVSRFDEVAFTRPMAYPTALASAVRVSGRPRRLGHWSTSAADAIAQFPRALDVIIDLAYDPHTVDLGREAMRLWLGRSAVGRGELGVRPDRATPAQRVHGPVESVHGGGGGGLLGSGEHQVACSLQLFGRNGRAELVSPTSPTTSSTVASRLPSSRRRERRLT